VSDLPTAVRSRVALNAGVDLSYGVDVVGCDRSNRSGLGCFVAVGPESSGVKRSTKHHAVVEGWRLIATNDELKLRASRQQQVSWLAARG